MEIESVVKSIVEKKVAAMSFNEIMDALYHGGKWFKVEGESFNESANQVADGLWGIVSQMKKDDVLQVLKKSYHGIEGASEHFVDMCGCILVVGIDGVDKEITPYSYDSASDWDGVLKNARKVLSSQMIREYMEKVENKVGEILDTL